MTLTGTAAAHADITDDIANLTTTWADSAFSGVLAANVTGATNTGISVDFRDITLAYATTTFVEVPANNGTITTTSALTLTGDTFSLSSGNFTLGTHYTVANVPAGMTVQITATSNTAATVSLTGTATNHLDINDAANLTISWLDAAFTNAPAANITDANKTNFVIDFANQPSIAYLGSGFTESITNNGTVTDSIIVQLTGDTFQDIDNDNILDVGTEVVLANIPAGFTPVLTLSSGDTVATVTLTGTA